MKYIVFIAMLAVLMMGCRKQPGEAHAEQYTCPMHPQVLQDKPGQCPICHMDLVKVGAPADDGSLMLNQTQIKLGNITTARAVAGNVEAKTVLNGRVVVDQNRSETVSARVTGRIDRLYVKEEGTYVHKGQPLYELYSEELVVLEKEYLASFQQRARGDDAGTYDTFVRAAEKKLLLFGMTPSQIHKIAESGEVLPRTVVFANASGSVSAIGVREGEYVSEGDPLFKLENLDKLWIMADLYAAETHALYQGDTVEIKVIGFENQPVKASVIFVNPEFRNNTQVLSVRLQIDNPNHRFLPGMQAQIVSSKIERRVLNISRDAVIHDGDQNYAWVLNPNGSYAPRRILTGVENENMTEVRYGLAENDNVVVTGAYLLHSEMILKKGRKIEHSME